MLTLKSGVGWDGCDIPTDKYTYSIASQIEVTDEKGVDESSDGRVAALLAWIPQKKIHGDDNQVTCFEEVVYFVKDDPVIVNGPAMWQATIRVFSVWEQEEQLISFKLKKE